MLLNSTAIIWALGFFLANEVVAQIFALLNSRRLLRGWAVHGWLALPALAVVLAPAVADLGSGAAAVALPPLIRPVAAVLATMASQAALWAQVFLLTGMVLDGMRGAVPDRNMIVGNSKAGMLKGSIYSGVLMGLLQFGDVLVSMAALRAAYHSAPFAMLAMAGGLSFPLLKTVIESFDGSQNFYKRAVCAYRSPTLYARGLLMGLAVAVALGMHLPARDTGLRLQFGAVAGFLAYAGVSMARDLVLGFLGRGGIKSARLYLVDSGMGAFIGAALAFYLDVNQIPIVLTKFHLYTSFGMRPDDLVSACNMVRTTRPDEFRLLLNNWGYIKLTPASGGAKMLLNEAIIGVSVWGIAAWMFAINRAFMQAGFDRSWQPVKRLTSREGVADLVAGTLRVMRWGLWMSPVMFSLLRPMGTPTWYNQDGAIRSLFAAANSLLMSEQEFNAWSLGVFTLILVYGGFRILIFIDHMGLRVATLVNLSFIGMDRLDEKVARFIGPHAAARYIPEGVKRFTTWAPLLIPFYLPAGAEWDKVWVESRTILAQSGDGMDLSLVAWVVFLVPVAAAAWLCRLRARSKANTGASLCLRNINYAVELKPSGEMNSRLTKQNLMLTRPAYEGIEPAGRALFLSEKDAAGNIRSWPVLGNHPGELFPKATVTMGGGVLSVVQNLNGLRATLRISLPDGKAAVELWEFNVENLSESPRELSVTPYFEWLLCAAGEDRNHTQYNRLYQEMSYDSSLNAVLASHRIAHKVGFIAAAKPPEGFLTGRVNFIGRAGTLWSPAALRTGNFLPCRDTAAYPTFDPIGALRLAQSVGAKGIVKITFLAGCADSRQQAAEWINHHLAPEIRAAEENAPTRHPKIGHGEIPVGTKLPYTTYEDAGATLHVCTPFTPRPFDHTMSNPLGHVLCVTNRGLHTSASGNAQQNRLTTDWADVVTRELPAEAFYIYEESEKAWFSPTYEPLRDPAARHDVRFSLDGSATFAMSKDWLETELTTHVPIDAPSGVYLLTLRNRGSRSRRLRVAPYFQIVLAHSPEMAGKLEVQRDAEGVLFFSNRNNAFRSGPAFVAMSHAASAVTTERGAFFGAGRSFAHPVFVETGMAAPAGGDVMACAALVAEMEIPADGEITIAVLLGQSDTLAQARACIAGLRSVPQAQSSLARTREWWRRFASTVSVRTSDPGFDGYVNWMKYQALSERIWARKGFYQASGAFGYRDQLQDAVNLIWVDPVLARKQLLLHAAQQFPEGDVVHWLFRTQDGRTGFACRSHSSDNLLWLAWGVSEYVRMTGDIGLLDEPVTYLHSEEPLPPLPQGRHGMSFHPLRSPVADDIFTHVMKALDLVLEKRMGAGGLPLIGTGDWNDGLDEIGSQGRGESVWLAFFLSYILKNFLPTIERRDGAARREHYGRKLHGLVAATEKAWRGDRYLRAIHDDGTEIGVEGAGYWETDALTAAWAVYSGINMERSRIALDTAIRLLEAETTISLGDPPLRADSKPFLGRSSHYPEGVRENGMYCHGVQWLVGACRLLSEQLAASGDAASAKHYRDASARLWFKISAIPHSTPEQIEISGGQPNKQAADYLTKFDPGRMIWNGYTGAAAWMFRQAIEGVMGAALVDGEVKLPADFDLPRGSLTCKELKRDVSQSPLER